MSVSEIREDDGQDCVVAEYDHSTKRIRIHATYEDGVYMIAQIDMTLSDFLERLGALDDAIALS